MENTFMMALEALLQMAEESESKFVNGHSFGYESEEKSSPNPKPPMSGSTWSEPSQAGPYGQPKSFTISGQKGQDRYGHVDNSDNLSSDGRTGGNADQCPKCGGSGVLDEYSCPQCNGTGVIQNEGQDYKITPEVESAYESAERSGAHGIENEDSFDENKHPRAQDGKFGSGGGGSSKGNEESSSKISIKSGNKIGSGKISQYTTDKAITIWHSTDNKAPAISDKIERLIPYSISTSPTKDSVWGKNSFKGKLEAGSNIVEIDVKNFTAGKTPLEIGKAVHEYAKSVGADAVKILNIPDIGTEIAVINQEKINWSKKNSDGPMVGRFEYPNDHPPDKALDFPRSFKKINSSYADWSGKGQNAIQDVPDDYKASTLFVDMAPYLPTMEKGKEKYGTSVEQNKLNEMVSDYQKDMDYKKFNTRMENPGKVDEALWDKGKRASEDAFGKIKYPFVTWFYKKQGGTFE